eukprot:2809252-Pyramimonas_sp.AAC.1
MITSTRSARMSTASWSNGGSPRTPPGRAARSLRVGRRWAATASIHEIFCSSAMTAYRRPQASGHSEVRSRPQPDENHPGGHDRET